MIEHLVETGTFEGYWAYVVAPVILFLALRLVRRLRSVRKVYAKFLWPVTVVEVAVYVAAAYSFGLLLEGILLGAGLPWSFVEDGHLPALLVYLAAFTSVARFVEVWLLRLRNSKDRLSTSRLERTVLYGAGLLLGLLSFLVAYGYTFLSISAGAVTAMLAFAMQRTLGDLVAGVAMSVEGAFRVGDWIKLSDGTEGEVVDIDWRATHFKGWDRAVMIIPNTALASQNFTSLPRKEHSYAQSYQISVSAAESPAHVKELLRTAACATNGVLDRPSPAIRLADISSDPYQYSLWVHFENYMAMFAGRDELFANIDGALKHAGVAISPDIINVQKNGRENPHDNETSQVGLAGHTK